MNEVKKARAKELSAESTERAIKLTNLVSEFEFLTQAVIDVTQGKIITLVKMPNIDVPVSVQVPDDDAEVEALVIKLAEKRLTAIEKEIDDLIGT